MVKVVKFSFILRNLQNYNFKFSSNFTSMKLLLKEARSSAYLRRVKRETVQRLREILNSRMYFTL